MKYSQSKKNNYRKPKSVSALKKTNKTTWIDKQLNANESIFWNVIFNLVKESYGIDFLLDRNLEH